MSNKAYLDLGAMGANTVELTVANICAAAAQAHKFGYRMARVMIAGRYVYIAAEESAVAPTPTFGPAQQPARLSIFGIHEKDTSRP